MSAGEPTIELPTLADVEAAAGRLAGRLERTPLVPLEDLVDDGEALLKLESRQVTGSFKPRGALNASLRAVERGGVSGLATASSGNHGQAVALAGEQLGLPCLVVAPVDARETKLAGMQARGAEVVLHGRTSAERLGRVAELAA
ncbi:MAG: pyridoxal-phosphate dependent enzyme, partial [Acidobacteriota bacterium]